MEAPRSMPRLFWPAAVLSAVLVLPCEVAFGCEESNTALIRVAGEGKPSESRASKDAKDAKDKCKRASGSRAPLPKGCPDGGERLPNENNKRSPLDDAPPLTPLVA